MGPTSTVGESEKIDCAQFSFSLPHFGRAFQSALLTLEDVPKTGVFEHPLHASLASFEQVFNNPVQQWQPFNNCVKGLLDIWGISSFGPELLRVRAPCSTQRSAKGPTRGHRNCRHSDHHALGKGVLPEELILVQSGRHIGWRVIAALFADGVDTPFSHMGTA